MSSPLQKAALKANRSIFKILPSFCLIFPERENSEIFGYSSSQSTNFLREDVGYTDVKERIFYTDRNKMSFTPELNEKVLFDGVVYQIKQITVQEPNIKLTLLQDLYE